MALLEGLINVLRLACADRRELDLLRDEEEDDLEVAVPEGTKCRHNGCSVVYESDDLHRKEGEEASDCTYHPKPVSTQPLLKLATRRIIPMSPKSPSIR